MEQGDVLKLAKLSGILGSNHVGERASASLKATEFLKSRNLTLGLAEAGFFPGIIFYLTLWYPSRKRASRTALFIAAIPVAGVIRARLSLASRVSNASRPMAAPIWWKLECFDYSKVACTAPSSPCSSAISSGRNLRSGCGTATKASTTQRTQKVFANELVASRPPMLPKSPSFMFIVYYLPEL